MNLLRCYFMVGGSHFDVESYAHCAKGRGLGNGVSRYTSNLKKLTRAGTDEVKITRIESGVTGTAGDGFYTWRTDDENYLHNRGDVFVVRGVNVETATEWLREEMFLIGFLMRIMAGLPNINDYCVGESFSLLKVIYGYEEGGEPGCGYHYSEKLIDALSKLKAGLSADSETFESHFMRLDNKVVLG